MVIIFFIFLPILFFPTLYYIYWLLKKRSSSNSYNRKRFKYFGYTIFSVNFVFLLYFSEKIRIQNEIENSIRESEHKQIVQLQLKKMNNCSLKVNKVIDSFEIKKIILFSKVDQISGFNHLMIVVLNNYLYLTNHEKKQFNQILSSVINKTCGEEFPFIIYDQLFNSI